MRPSRAVFLLLLAAWSALGASATSRTRTSSARSVLPFIADNYTRAVAEARARKVPLFIEAWAPW